MRYDTFARLTVEDEQARGTKVELGYDWRAREAPRLAFGPVLHADDAVANKMCALWGRGEARDYVDINAVLASGRYSTTELLRLAAEHDPGFDPLTFAEALERSDRWPDAALAAYDLEDESIAALRKRLTGWAQELRR
jgi:hypothetical protein